MSPRGEQQKAIERFTQSLELIRQVGDDRSGEALTLTNLGAAYDRAGDPQKAFDCYTQALPIAVAVKDPIREALVFHGLMLNRKAAQPALVVFYGEQSVNLLQQVRGNMQGLDKNLQKSFLNSKGEFYHDLADLLIAQGRLPEAQRVLDLLKQQEYQDYVRGETANTLSPLALTPAEQQAEQDYAKSTTLIVGLAQQWEELNKNGARTPEQDKQYKRLSDQLDAAGKMLRR